MYKKLSSIALSLLFFAGCATQQSSTLDFRPSELVNPLVGSQSDFSLSTGNTYPAIAMPWGMNFWTPQTGKMGDGWAYQYQAPKIRGFKQTHQPSPWINDYGQFSIMPVNGMSKIDEDSRASVYSHKAEEVHPYYYSVYLADHDIKAEFAPTERAVIMNFTMPKSDSTGIVIDAFDRGSYVKVLQSENTIVGYSTKNSGGVPENFKNWFVVKFDQPFTGYSVWDGDKKYGANKSEITDFHTGVVVNFPSERGDVITARIASSFISLEQAYLNLREIGDADLATIKEAGQERWDDVLGRIEVEGNDMDQLRTFYSCLYRSTLFPRKFYEFDAEGKMIHYSPYNGEVCDGPMYTDTGFWDTFRALFPLLNLVYPSVNTEIQEALVNTYKESGFLPEWASPGHRGCMVGNNSASIVADAMAKGLEGYDLNTLYEAMTHGANNVHAEVSSTGRLGSEYYNNLGYVPYDVDIHENAARTLEYAFNDWSIMQVAKKLGRPAEEIDTYAKRAMNYKNLYDTEYKLMRGRNEDGTFQSPFSPYKWGGAFTEGNSWHYTWSVFHDIQGLSDLMGGDDQFVGMLDSVFVVPPIYDDSYYGFRIHEITEMTIMNMGNYAHGNQPIQHMTYLYNYGKQPWKSQYWVRQIMDKLYTPNPDGYCGDEDNGQTSAWYVFSSLGFYPVCPGTNEYVVGAPLFKKATIHLENGENIVISAPENSKENIYIESAELNGSNNTRNYLTHDELLEGAKIDYKMSAEPNTKRGIGEDDKPYSFSAE